MTQFRSAKFALDQIVRHRDAAFRGVVIDVDAAYAGPAREPGPDQRDQPFYRVLAMGEEAGFLVYAAEGVLEHDPELGALTEAEQARWFTIDRDGHRAPRNQPIH
ncbi:MAG: heat shock protein HspQ [Brevundimonas sp.]|nr:heat shock protein HspQ [Brevundimonas sp.]MCA3717572.1 heat shock protein HspQ [Brevundimonas sp.]